MNGLLGQIGGVRLNPRFQQKNTCDQMAHALGSITFNSAPTYITSWGTTSSYITFADWSTTTAKPRRELPNLEWLDKRISEIRVAL